MFRKAHQSMWSILSLLIGNLVDPLVDIVRHLVTSDPLKFILTKCRPDFQWFKLSRLYLDISWPQINFFIAFTHRLVNKLQKTLKQTRWFLESLRISYGHENKLTKHDVILFQSRRGHFWFVFVKFSEIVEFSHLEHHGLCKTKFWELILLPIGITDVFENDFQQNKNCPNFVAFDL